MLISPEDLTTMAEVDALFTTSEKIWLAHAYVDCINYTPPALCGDLHILALQKWTDTDEGQANHPEPWPTIHFGLWKCWLYQKHATDANFWYIQ